MNFKELLKKAFRFFMEEKVFTVIFFGGAIVRLLNINWGLPELYEEATPLVKAWKMWNWGHSGFEFNPHFFNYPALLFYLNFSVQIIHYGLGHLIGIYDSLASFGTTLTPVVIPARCISVLFDLGTITIIYLFAEKLAGKRTAIIAGSLAAFSPLLVQQAHLIAVDTPLTFFTVLSLYYVYQLTITPERKWFIFAGVSIGLAAATKYTGAFLIPVLVMGSLIHATSLSEALTILKKKDIIISVCVAIVCFIVFNPFILSSFDEFLRDFSYEQHHVAAGHLGIDPTQSTTGYYLLSVLPNQLGWLVFGSFIIMTLRVLFQRQGRRVLLLLFPIAYTAIISTWEMRAERYILPIIPILLIFSAIGIDGCIEQCGQFLRQRLPRLFSGSIDQSKTSVAIGLIFLAQPLYNLYTYERTIGLPNTRAIAKEWISQNLPKGSTLATGPFGIQFPPSTYEELKIPFRVLETENVAMFYDTRWYEDVDLLIASDYDYQRYAQDPVKYRDFLPFYDSLRSRWQLAYEVAPTDAQDGPRFWLYRPPKSPPIFESTLFEKLQGSTDSLRISNFLHDLTIVLIDKERWDKCEQTLRTILAVELENTLARNTLATILYNKGRYSEALEQINISLKVKPQQEEVIRLGDMIVQKLKGQ